MTPLSAALGAELCPVDPWHCVRDGQTWVDTLDVPALRADVSYGRREAVTRTAIETARKISARTLHNLTEREAKRLRDLLDKL